MNCIICSKKGNNKFPCGDKIINLCWDCDHKIRETIIGLNDGIPDLISQDIMIKSLATKFYEQHKQEITSSISKEIES
jgi:hypothetical protein